MALTKDNTIGLYFNCKKCSEELPDGQSMKTYSRYGVGLSALGVQVWCYRHDMNIVSIDFQGQKHPYV